VRTGRAVRFHHRKKGNEYFGFRFALEAQGFLLTCPESPFPVSREFWQKNGNLQGILSLDWLALRKRKSQFAIDFVHRQPVFLFLSSRWRFRGKVDFARANSHGQIPNLCLKRTAGRESAHISPTQSPAVDFRKLNSTIGSHLLPDFAGDASYRGRRECKGFPKRSLATPRFAIVNTCFRGVDFLDHKKGCCNIPRLNLSYVLSVFYVKCWVVLGLAVTAVCFWPGEVSRIFSIS
jgi:hypothetical protein